MGGDAADQKPRPDVTRLARRDGELPALEVARTIAGRSERPAHGPRDTPVWGWRLYGSTSVNKPAERARVDAAGDRMVKYLRAAQSE